MNRSDGPNIFQDIPNTTSFNHCCSAAGERLLRGRQSSPSRPRQLIDGFRVCLAKVAGS
ncbi:hypothetical protein Hdeb2414_s0007g00244821 [Helianthus debilis subsp. tardiflorus]